MNPKNHYTNVGDSCQDKYSRSNHNKGYNHVFMDSQNTADIPV
jgi:hypothetical protein